MPQLSLDPQSLQALNDLVAATRAATSANRQATQQQTGVAQQLAGLHSQAAQSNQHQLMGNAWQAHHAGQASSQAATQSAHLQNLTNLQMGQAMGQKLWQNPVNGQMQWIPGGSGGAGGSGGGGKAPPGMMSQMGLGGLSRLAAPLAIAHTLGNAVESGGRLVHDKYTGGANAERQFFRDVVPGGGWAQRIVDSASGRTAAMEGNQIQADIGHAQGGVRAEQDAFYTSRAPDLVGRKAVAQAYQLQSPSAAAPPVVDRSTAGGEQAYKDAMKVLPLTKERLKTERELSRTFNEQRQAETNLATFTGNRLTLEKKIVEARANATRFAGVDAVKENKHLQDLDVLQKRHDQAVGTERAAHAVVDEKKVATGRAQAEYNKARIREEKLGQADILDDKAARAKGTAATLGAMNPLEREQAIQAVEIGKKHGLDALPPEMKQMFQQLAPKEFEAAAVKAGAGSEGFGRLQRAGIVDAPGGQKLFGIGVGKTEKPADLQKKADTLRKEAAEGEHAEDTKGADVAAKAGDKMFEAVDKLFDEAIRKMAQKIEDKVRLSKSS